MVKYIFIDNNNSQEIRPDKNDIENINVDIMSKYNLKIVPDKYCFVNSYGEVFAPLDGDMFLEISNQIENRYDFHMGMIPIEVDDCTDNLRVLNEDVAYRYKDNNEKARHVNTFINKLVNSGEKKEELIITDYYLFSPKSSNDYKDLLVDILNGSQFKKIIVITSSHKDSYCQGVKTSIEKRLNSMCNLKIECSEEIHDRFWIANRRKSFVMGTSLNGFGGRLCCIQIIDDDDTKEIMKVLVKENLINGVTL